MPGLIKNFKITLIRGIVWFFNAIGMKKNRNAKPLRFLVINTTGIGDTLWGTPAIRALRETYPECYIGVLTNPQGLGILKENPHINSLFVFERGIRGILQLPGLLKSLRQKQFEVAFIFHSSDRIIWPLSFFTGAGEIIGNPGDSKGIDFILTKHVDMPVRSHGIYKRLLLVEQVGATAKDSSIEIFLTGGDKKRAAQILRDKGIQTDSLIIGLHTGAQKTYKCWPSDNFISLGNILVKKLKCSIIITGSGDESKLADMVSSKIENAVSMAGKLNIRETAAVIEKMDVFIVNDTGPMHIAFALQTPTVALFSPTDPELCGPYKAAGKFSVISKPIICSPCVGKRCVVPSCMGEITVAEVLKSIEGLINSEKRDGK